MIGSAPSCTRSKYFNPDPEWHIEADAPTRDKRIFEKQMNTEENRYIWFLPKYKKMKKPYLRWNGEVIDRGEVE